MFISNSTYPQQFYDPNYQFKDWFTPRGWICPRCDQVNAPSVMTCPCSHNRFSLATSTRTDSGSVNVHRCPTCGEYIATFHFNGEVSSGKCACERKLDT